MGRSVGPTHHNTNLEPLVSGPRIVPAEHHAKGHRDGYVERERRRREEARRTDDLPEGSHGLEFGQERLCGPAIPIVISGSSSSSLNTRTTVDHMPT